MGILKLRSLNEEVTRLNKAMDLLGKVRRSIDSIRFTDSITESISNTENELDKFIQTTNGIIWKLNKELVDLPTNREEQIK